MNNQVTSGALSHAIGRAGSPALLVAPWKSRPDAGPALPGCIAKRGGRREPMGVSFAAGIRNTQPLAATGCGYLPIGALPTGYLPIGALPTGAAGGGGSLRGRSAAAAALNIAIDAAVMVRIFNMAHPLVFRVSLERPGTRNPRAMPNFLGTITQPPALSAVP